VRKYSVFAALIVLILGDSLGASRHAIAQSSPITDPTWVGRATTSHTCHAAVDDLGGLTQTLGAFEQMRLRFRQKADTGYYGDAKALDRTWLNMAAPREVVEEIGKYLSRLGNSYALVYDIGVRERQYSLCIWLLSDKGLEAAATIPLPNWSPAQVLQAVLQVDTREAKRARQIRPHGAQSSHATCPPAQLPVEEGALRALTGEQGGNARGALRQAADVLMSEEIRSRLRDLSDSRILILPAVDFGTVPFAALPIDAHRTVADVASIIVLANVEGLYKGQPLGLWGNRTDQDETLIVGDPDLSTDPSFCFNPLPYARSEAEFAAKTFHASPLMGSDATITAAKAWHQTHYRPKLLYFATHGVADPVNPMDASFLAIRDGHLFGREINRLVLPSHPLVVMSACQSGLGKVFQGGVFGLARAWHFAGAPQVVVSLWNVDDWATSVLMERFLTYLTDGVATEFALRKAMLEVRERMIPADGMPDPALFASFTVFGLPTPSSTHGEP
jgi:CHAT domain-containing protein